MNCIKKLFKLKFFLPVFIILISISVIAQPGGGGCPPDECPDINGDCQPCDEVPIDGGASWLLAAGAIYGFKRLKDAKRKTVKDSEH
jgi:hypothetical protein